MHQLKEERRLLPQTLLQNRTDDRAAVIADRAARAVSDAATHDVHAVEAAENGNDRSSTRRSSASDALLV